MRIILRNRVVLVLCLSLGLSLVTSLVWPEMAVAKNYKKSASAEAKRKALAKRQVAAAKKAKKEREAKALVKNEPVLYSEKIVISDHGISVQRRDTSSAEKGSRLPASVVEKPIESTYSLLKADESVADEGDSINDVDYSVDLESQMNDDSDVESETPFDE